MSSLFPSLSGCLNSVKTKCGSYLTSAGERLRQLDEKTFKVGSSALFVYRSIRQSKPTEAFLGSIQFVRGCAAQLAIASYLQAAAEGASVENLLTDVPTQESSIPLAKSLLMIGLACNVLLETASAYKARILKKGDLEGNNLPIERIFNREHLGHIVNLGGQHIRKIFNRQVYTSCAFTAAYGATIGIFTLGGPLEWGLPVIGFITAAKMVRFAIFNRLLLKAIASSSSPEASTRNVLSPAATKEGERLRADAASSEEPSSDSAALPVTTSPVTPPPIQLTEICRAYGKEEPTPHTITITQTQ